MRIFYWISFWELLFTSVPLFSLGAFCYFSFGWGLPNSSKKLLFPACFFALPFPSYFLGSGGCIKASKNAKSPDFCVSRSFDLAYLLELSSWLLLLTGTFIVSFPSFLGASKLKNWSNVTVFFSSTFFTLFIGI